MDDNQDLRLKKKKRSKPIEIDFDSDNDEPIGSLFKIKRNKKKVNFVASESGIRENDSSRVMDDNEPLASFRKRLKGPKRDQGSGLNDGLVGSGSGSVSKDEKKVDLMVGDNDMQVNDSADQNMEEESLSVIFHKVQSKKKRGNRNVDSGLKHGCKSLTENVDLTVESRSGSASALKSVEGRQESDTFCSVSAVDEQKSGDECFQEEKGKGICDDSSIPDGSSVGHSKSLIACDGDRQQSDTFCLVSTMDEQKGGDECLQEEKVKGIYDSNIPDGSSVDHSNSIIVCDGDRQQLSSVQVEDVCRASDKKVALQEKINDDSLNQCSDMLPDVEVIDSGSPSNVGDGVCGFSDSKELNKSVDAIAEEQVCNGASEGGVSTSFGKEILLTCHTGLLIESNENILKENDAMVSGKTLQESSINGDIKMDTEFVSGGNCYDCSTSDANAEVQDVVGCSPEKLDAIASGSLSAIVPNDANESELVVQSNHPDKPLEMCDVPKYSTASILKCSSVSDPIQSDGCSIQSSIPDENGNVAEYHASVSDFADNGGKISGNPRTIRKTKMHKHGDMTYEGDADWEILINDKALNESHGAADGERSLKTRVKQDSSLNDAEDSENVAVAAVSAGLKACAVCPIEKIKFKEILKRKGGLKEYLDCRNQILSLWSSDVTRILPLSECGVGDARSENESSRSSLIREVYAFLDQHDSMGKDGTQLLRHCLRLLVRVSTDLGAVRLSGMGKTVKEKVCVHTSRDIRAIASQLVNVWLEIFRKEKASNGGLKLSRQAATVELSKRKSLKESASGKPPLSTHQGAIENKGGLLNPVSAGSNSPSTTHAKKLHSKQGRQPSGCDSRHEVSSSRSQGSIDKIATKEERNHYAMSEEEKAALAAAEAARTQAIAAAQAYASAEARCSTLLQLPKIPSFHKFARREQYSQNDEYDSRKKLSGGFFGRQDCVSEIDSRNCRVRDWSVDFSTACVNLDNSNIPVDNLSQRSHSNEIASHLNFGERSGESAAVDSNLYTKAWIDTTGDGVVKDHLAIERWQSQAAEADSHFSNPTSRLKDEEDSNAYSSLPSWKHEGIANESSVSQVTVNKEALKGHSRGADHIKQAVVDYVGSLLMPLYKARKLDKDGYKAIMKKSATKVMEQATDAEKAMTVRDFLDFKRRNKIRSFVDVLIERHMATKPGTKS